MEARQQILSALEKAVGSGRVKGHSEPVTREVRPPVRVPPEETWDEVSRELNALSDSFHMIEDKGQLRGLIEEIVREHGVTRAVMWDHPLLKGLGLDDLLKGLRVETGTIEEAGIEFAAGAQLGITAADALIAEGGTLVQRSGKGRERSTSLLPPVHLALVTPGELLRDFSQLPGLLRQWMETEKRMPSAVTLIAGHSRTGDIELIIVSGVHGPGRVYVAAVDTTSFSAGEKNQ